MGVWVNMAIWKYLLADLLWIKFAVIDSSRSLRVVRPRNSASWLSLVYLRTASGHHCLQAKSLSRASAFCICCCFFYRLRTRLFRRKIIWSPCGLPVSFFCWHFWVLVPFAVAVGSCASLLEIHFDPFWWIGLLASALRAINLDLRLTDAPSWHSVMQHADFCATTFKPPVSIFMVLVHHSKFWKCGSYGHSTPNYCCFIYCWRRVLCF